MEIATEYDWLKDRVSEGGHYSQFGEDGILDAIFERIGMNNRWCFECGAGGSPKGSNVWKRMLEGWTVLMVETDPHVLETLVKQVPSGFAPRTMNRNMEVSGDNSLDGLLAEFGAPLDIDFVVIDIDGQDALVFESMACYRPRVMIVEFGTWEGMPALGDGREHQADENVIDDVARDQGYTPVAKTQVNMIMVRDDLAGLVAS
jgi:hypothetical protein